MNQGWFARPKEEGRSDSVLLPTLGHKRHHSFHLALWDHTGGASHHVVRTLVKPNVQTHMERVRGPQLTDSMKVPATWESHLQSRPCIPGLYLRWQPPWLTSWLQPPERPWAKATQPNCSQIPDPQKSQEIQIPRGRTVSAHHESNGWSRIRRIGERGVATGALMAACRSCVLESINPSHRWGNRHRVPCPTCIHVSGPTHHYTTCPGSQGFWPPRSLLTWSVHGQPPAAGRSPHSPGLFTWQARNFQVGVDMRESWVLPPWTQESHIRDNQRAGKEHSFLIDHLDTDVRNLLGSFKRKRLQSKR